ncbi:MAG: hypothetical protein KDC87_07255 [Planctomycetes bacterium]|nr:hypothetical protein [Planctomycetota bacterium]
MDDRDRIERASTGRASCRGCRQRIAKGAWRFGLSVDNPFVDQEGATTLHWYHPVCGADRCPERFAAALLETEHELPEHARLARIAELGCNNPELAKVLRAEVAPTGRARCRQCREMIAKDTLRVAIEVETEAMSMASAFYIHLACAPARLGAAGLREKLERVSEGLTAEHVAELRTVLG